MALFYQHNINDDTRLGIWRIEEPEDFFLQKVPLKQDVSHPYKRLQHLAGRILLPELFEDFPLEEIRVADTRKPYLEDEKYHFSISHCGNFAAAIASPVNRVGVDIELVSPRIKGIAPKFLNKIEQEFLDSYAYMPHIALDLVTMLWSSKEAIFKWYGKGQVDFSRHIRLELPATYGTSDWMTLNFHFTKEDPEQKLRVHARVSDGLALAYVVS